MATVVFLVIVEEVRLAVTVTVVMAIFGLAMVNIRYAIAMTIAFLIVLGDLRRILIGVAGWSGEDPLLLIGTLVASLLMAHAWSSRRVKLDTPLAKWTLAFLAVMTLQVFNPNQGDLIVGVGGIMFMMSPLFWYWVARSYLNVDLTGKILYYLVLPLSMIAAILGYYQIFYGYLPYQMDWYNITGYVALGNPETGLAPISFFASATEHSNFLSIGIVLLTALALHKNRGALLLIPILFLGIFLTGSRGPVIRVLFTVAAMWALLGSNWKTWIARSVVALTIVVVGLIWSLSQIGPGLPLSSGPVASVQGKLERQASLLESHEEKGGTIRVHSYMMIQGYLDAFRKPLGMGLGSTTKAAQKYLDESLSTETDTGNVMRGTGLIGGIIYHVMIFFIGLSAIRTWKARRDPVSLALVGILIVTFLNWLGGGQYAVSPLTWLCIGTLDRFQSDRQADRSAPSLQTDPESSVDRVAGSPDPVAEAS
jgi:hypothetical protein